MFERRFTAVPVEPFGLLTKNEFDRLHDIVSKLSYSDSDFVCDVVDSRDEELIRAYAEIERQRALIERVIMNVNCDYYVKEQAWVSQWLKDASGEVK